MKGGKPPRSVEEVAGLVVYLASPLADPVTGSEYLIDCGFSVTGFRRAASDVPDAEGAVRGVAAS